MKTTSHIIEYITLDRRVIQLLNFGKETYSEVDLQKRKEKKNGNDSTLLKWMCYQEQLGVMFTSW